MMKYIALLRGINLVEKIKLRWKNLEMFCRKMVTKILLLI